MAQETSVVDSASEAKLAAYETGIHAVNMELASARARIDDVRLLFDLSVNQG